MATTIRKILRIRSSTKNKRPRTISRDFYTLWVGFSLTFGFLLIALPSVIAASRSRWHWLTHRFYRVWAWVLLHLIGAPPTVEYRFIPNPKQLYVFTPNHFSYIDIPVMVYGIRQFFVFMGKSSLSKIPLFGYIFRKVHIPVNRANAKNRYHALERAKESVAQGRSVLFFPEGGITSPNPPQMSPFKEGAFRLAIEMKIPIVPVTLPYNHFLIPDVLPIKVTRHPIHIIFHEPIPTEHLTLDDAEDLKNKTYDIIHQELKKYENKIGNSK